jgi:hypothetical protein
MEKLKIRRPNIDVVEFNSGVAICDWHFYFITCQYVAAEAGVLVRKLSQLTPLS